MKDAPCSVGISDTAAHAVAAKNGATVAVVVTADVLVAFVVAADTVDVVAVDATSLLEDIEQISSVVNLARGAKEVQRIIVTIRLDGTVARLPHPTLALQVLLPNHA